MVSNGFWCLCIYGATQPKFKESFLKELVQLCTKEAFLIEYVSNS